uniref:DC1 domain-containing protein n=1 Tax=Fagus sylvatica TaxID=28930 RepID=A0A2N9ECX6_FAGSY
MHCANYSPTIFHPYYPKCTFQFLPSPPGNTPRYCNGCEKDVTGFVYHCYECGYDLHPCCAKLPTSLHDGEVNLYLHKKVSAPCNKCGREGRSWSYRIGELNQNQTSAPPLSQRGDSLFVSSVKRLSLPHNYPTTQTEFGRRPLSLPDSIVSNLGLDHQEIDQISCTATGNDPGLGDVQVELSVWRRERVCLKRSSAALNGGGSGHLGGCGFHEFWF